MKNPLILQSSPTPENKNKTHKENNKTNIQQATWKGTQITLTPTLCATSGQRGKSSIHRVLSENTVFQGYYIQQNSHSQMFKGSKYIHTYIFKAKARIPAQGRCCHVLFGPNIGTQASYVLSGEFATQGKYWAPPFPSAFSHLPPHFHQSPNCVLCVTSSTLQLKWPLLSYLVTPKNNRCCPTLTLVNNDKIQCQESYTTLNTTYFFSFISLLEKQR